MVAVGHEQTQTKVGIRVRLRSSASNIQFACMLVQAFVTVNRRAIPKMYGMIAPLTMIGSSDKRR